MKLTSPHISFNKCLCFVCFKGEKSQGFAGIKQIIYIDIQQEVNPLYLVLVFFWWKNDFRDLPGLPPLLWLTQNHLGTITVVFVGSPHPTRPKNLRTQRWRFHGRRLEGAVHASLVGVWDVETATRVMGIFNWAVEVWLAFESWVFGVFFVKLGPETKQHMF